MGYVVSHITYFEILVTLIVEGERQNWTDACEMCMKSRYLCLLPCGISHPLDVLTAETASHTTGHRDVPALSVCSRLAGDNTM